MNDKPKIDPVKGIEIINSLLENENLSDWAINALKDLTQDYERQINTTR